jgi:DNA-binding beta-propeller fold protein YncE
MFRCLSFAVTTGIVMAVAAKVAAVPAVTATVPISPRPTAVAVASQGHRVFVADGQLGAVVPFDGDRGIAAAPIQVGGQPASLALDNQGQRLFVGNRDVSGAAVSVIDLASGRARSFLPDARRVRGLAFDEAINRLYAGDADTGELMIIDGASGQVTDHLTLGGTPTAIAVNDRDGEVAVAVQGPAPALALLDPTNRSAGLLNVPVPDGQPLQVAVDSGTGKFFVTRGGANPALLVLRPGSSAFDNAIPIAPGATGVAIDPRTSRIYLAHAPASSLTVVDGGSGTVVAQLPLNDTANHIAVDPSSTPTRVYSVDTASGLLSILTDR